MAGSWVCSRPTTRPSASTGSWCSSAVGSAIRTTASFGRTRSYRSDYLDPAYARFAREALRLWDEFETRTDTSVLVRCGCMNIAKRSVTPDLDEHLRAPEPFVSCEDLGIPSASFAGEDLRARFPYLEADVGYIDLDGGVVNLPAVTAALRRALAERGVRSRRGRDHRLDGSSSGRPDPGRYGRGRMVIAVARSSTAGHGTNDVLARLERGDPSSPAHSRPPDRGQVLHAPRRRSPEQFTSDAMPVIAYLDAGIYCHPIIDGLIDKVKIGYYHPPDLPRSTTAIDSVMSFVEQCLPVLRDARVEPLTTSTGATTTSSPTTSSSSAPFPAFPARYVGVGWRGTGYKFAPWVGRVLAELALHTRHRLRHQPLRPSAIHERKLPVQDRPSARTLQQRLAEGVVLGAEGYVFELERRGYIKAGPYVPGGHPRRAGGGDRAAPRVPARRR